MINGRQKGHTFEREVGHLFKPYFPEAKRCLSQSRGGNEGADIQGTPWFIECKRGKRVNIRKAFEQSHRNAEPDMQGKILVVSKEDQKPVVVSMEWDLFEALVLKKEPQ